MTPPEETPIADPPEPTETPATYLYSLDEEVYESEGYVSRDDAVAAAVSENSLEPGNVVWTGRTRPLRIEDLCDGGRFAEDIIDAAAGISGEESVEPWAQRIEAATDEQHADLGRRLAAAFHSWLVDNGLPDLSEEISSIDQIEEHFVGSEFAEDPDGFEAGDFDDDPKTEAVAKLDAASDASDSGDAP